MTRNAAVAGVPALVLASVLGCGSDETFPSSSEDSRTCREGRACDDGNACTKGDVCRKGQCVGTPYSCDDGNPCTADACDGAGGCTHAPLSGIACDDGDACTVGDTCQAGVCAGTARSCDDGNPCTADACDPSGACVHAAVAAACDDGNACTVNDTCTAGVCAGVTPVEICGNGLDDDCDGLVDAADPDCAAPPPQSVPPGLHITTVTTGTNLDPDGYDASLWLDWGTSWVGFSFFALPANGTFDVLNPQWGTDYVLEVRGTSLNCDLSGSNPRRFHLGAPWEPGVNVELDVQCAAATQLALANVVDGNGDVYAVRSNGAGTAPITTDPAWDAAPAWSPDGTKIAFESDRGGTPEIYVMDADGSNVVQLTATGGNFHPTWSPDGSRIAFVSVRDGDEEIYAMNADGSGAVNLTNDPAWDEDPAWSPDGSRIAFRSSRDGGTYQGIYLMSPDGSGVGRLTADPYVDDRQPAWSPDGGSLAISRMSCGFMCIQTIWIMSAADGYAWQMTGVFDCEGHGDPAWSPDGRKIAFTSNDWCGGTSVVYGVKLVGIDLYTSGVPIAPGSQPSWRR